MKEGRDYKKFPEISENLGSLRKPVTKKNRTAGIYPYYGASGEIVKCHNNLALPQHKNPIIIHYSRILRLFAE